ncbi:MAG: Mrp/NBP35 family ATP-binding protein [Gammaproteobacteria bacterium]|nr:Mrp/NBP35 family ATP-binding protein [Gammaproteobacteria bacterium]MDE0402365.1 Mrp/NBP35 family ATP-binding protein [Gammaproteobacteria bacterium]
MPQSLSDFKDPVANLTLEELGAIKRQGTMEGRFHLDLDLGYPCELLKASYIEKVRSWIQDETSCIEIEFVSPLTSQLSNVRNIIAIASGKGGVGKSTIAVNLALGLMRAGSRVGLLDADIYGPSQGIMLGIGQNTKPKIVDGKYFEPVRAHGIEAISMSMLVTDKTPMVWRGPMVSGALQQLIHQTKWSELDYLIVDMPPGTGDIQLTLSQQVALGGVVIVTTPQPVALADARKGIEMFSKVSVPILGIVENMSYFECDQCEKRHNVFSTGGGQLVANEYRTVLLGEFPLVAHLRESTDNGQPPVATDYRTPIASQFINCAQLIAAQLWIHARNVAPSPTIRMD